MVAAGAGLSPRGLAPFGDVKGSDWFAGWVATAEAAGLVGLMAPNPVWYGAVFEGDRPVTRAEAAMVLANWLMGTK